MRVVLTKMGLTDTYSHIYSETSELRPRIGLPKTSLNCEVVLFMTPATIDKRSMNSSQLFIMKVHA